MTPDEISKQIPDEVWQELVNEVHRITGIDIDEDEARAAIAAGLAAWPRVFEEYMNTDEGYAEPCLILPLPQKEARP